MGHWLKHSPDGVDLGAVGVGVLLPRPEVATPRVVALWLPIRLEVVSSDRGHSFRSLVRRGPLSVININDTLDAATLLVIFKARYIYIYIWSTTCCFALRMF